VHNIINSRHHITVCEFIKIAILEFQQVYLLNQIVEALMGEISRSQIGQRLKLTRLSQLSRIGKYFRKVWVAINQKVSLARFYFLIFDIFCNIVRYWDLIPIIKLVVGKSLHSGEKYRNLRVNDLFSCLALEVRAELNHRERQIIDSSIEHKAITNSERNVHDSF
jgi:hypothetical protein